MLWNVDPPTEQALFETLDQPAPALDLFGTVAFRAAAAALDLGFFRELATAPQNAATLAASCGCDPGATGDLLAVLERFGYVRQEAGLFALTPMAERWMVSPAAGFDFTRALRYWSLQLFELWDSLEVTVKTGRSGLHLYRWLDERPAAQRVFQEMLGHLAELASPQILDVLALPTERRHDPLLLLDLGAGHGRYAMAFLQQVPGARAILADSASAMAIARENAEAAGVASRCETQVCDLLHDPLPSQADVVFLFSILHGFDAATNLALLRRIHAAMKPGAVLAVLEQMSDQVDPDVPAVLAAFHQVFRLNLFHLMGGFTYASQEVVSWLVAAGFTVEGQDRLEVTGDILIRARR